MLRPAVFIGSTAYTGTNAILHYWTRAAGSEMSSLPVATNCLMLQGAPRTEQLIEKVKAERVPEYLCEPLDSMAKATHLLATAPHDQYHGVVISLKLLLKAGRPMINPDTGRLVPGSKVEHLAEHMAAPGASESPQATFRASRRTGDRGSTCAR